MSGCIERVPDHTDFNPCGKPILRADLCAEHVQQAVVALQYLIKRKEEEIAQCKKRLEQLQTESG